jgi:transposase
VRVKGQLHWLHVKSTRWLTHLAWHRKRGHEALEAIGIWPRFRGRSMRDRWASYDQYPCAHSICGAHLLRDLTLVQEQHQDWAADLKAVLLGMDEAAREWRERGATRVPAEERDEWVGQYFDVLARGFAAQPPPEAPHRRRGRGKQSAAKHLLDDLLRRADQVLAFLDESRDPLYERCDGILHSFRMVSVFWDTCEHSSEERARLAAGRAQSRGHWPDTWGSDPLVPNP